MKVALDQVEETTGRVVLTYFDAYYTVKDGDEPIIHITARDEDSEPYHVRVTDFPPYFCVPREERTVAEWDQLVAADHRVRDVKLDDEDVSRNEVVKVETVLPTHVRELRGEFANPLEADVQYETRFLVDNDIRQCFSVPARARDEPVPASAVRAIHDDRAIDVQPRICYFDIEVQQSEEGAAVVSERGTELALNPVTAIAAVDGYTDETVCWLLVHDSWDGEDAARIDAATGDATVELFDQERDLLASFCEWVAQRRFDVMTGWNSNSFDIPYLVNRCLKEQDVTDIFRWSPTRDVRSMDGEGTWLNRDLKGMIAFDMLDGFSKTEYTELDSYALDHVAAEVVGETKVDVGDIDDARDVNPATFAEYVVLDAQLVQRIDETRGILTTTEDDEQ